MYLKTTRNVGSVNLTFFVKHSLDLFSYFLYLTILLFSQLPAVMAAPLKCFSLWMKINSLAIEQISFEHITKC